MSVLCFSNLQLYIALVIAAHKSDLNQMLSRGHFGIYYTAAGFRCRGERLLTEYWLSGFHSRKHKLLMERI